MTDPRRVRRLLFVLACLAPGCATPARYPFREKPRPPAEPPAQSQGGAAHVELERELSLYSD